LGSLVALVHCDSYAYEKVHEAVKKGIDLLGGTEKFALSNEKILLKPNILTGANPGKCITTHPMVFKAVAQVFRSTGARILYGDNPGVISIFSAIRKSGFLKIAREIGIELGDFNSTVSISRRASGFFTNFHIVKAVTECNGVISIPKFKTHSFTRITGCVKNQYGCLSFLQKRAFHAKLPDNVDFAKMLLQLNHYIHPRLYIMDAIWAMEGNGPSAGSPKQLNVLGFSTDPIALDATMCRIVSLEPRLVPTVMYGEKFGYGECEQEKIRLIGDSFDDLITDEFKINRSRFDVRCERSLPDKIMHQFEKVPVILKSVCKHCGNCYLACPTEPKAIHFNFSAKSETPVVNSDRCIRCYCCQEVCPERAIKLRRQWTPNNLYKAFK
jgi:uncharacterized protein (DUF362 family)